MKSSSLLFSLLVLTVFSSYGRDYLHFYRASPPLGGNCEPRFEMRGLTSVNAYLSGGSTNRSFDGCGRKTCLLDLYGPQVGFDLGAGTPCKDFTNPASLALQMNEMEPARNGFGLFSYSGKFSILELDLQLYQNFSDGFFLEIYVPVRKLHISDIACKDLSSECAPCPNESDPMWQAYLHQFNNILSQNCLCVGDVKKVGFGDTALMFGWAENYAETEYLDFIDFMLQAGILIPTGRRANPDIAFDLPIGYNGHIGFPMNMNIAFGLYEWFTLGSYVMVMPFKKACQEIRMKTSTTQNGFIKLAKGRAQTKPGSLWQIGTYLKADHFLAGMSFILGYSYSKQQPSSVSPICCDLFDQSIVCSDSMFAGWKMHTIHLMGEWDFLKELGFFGPRIAVFGNIVVGGSRIFNTSMGGGIFGIDLIWSY